MKNVSEISFPHAWVGTTIFYSPNLEEDVGKESWGRNFVTHYDELTGCPSWTRFFGSMYFVTKKCAVNPAAEVQSSGQSLEGREMDLVKIGTGNHIARITHRQHTGETVPEYYAEGVPIKDCATNPDPERAWIPNRSRMLGASVVPLLYIQPYLRAAGEFWQKTIAAGCLHPSRP